MSRYKVRVADQDTGAETTLILDATSVDAAVKCAHRMGVLVVGEAERVDDELTTAERWTQRQKRGNRKVRRSLLGIVFLAALVGIGWVGVTRLPDVFRRSGVVEGECFITLRNGGVQFASGETVHLLPRRAPVLAVLQGMWDQAELEYDLRAAGFGTQTEDYQAGDRVLRQEQLDGISEVWSMGLSSDEVKDLVTRYSSSPPDEQKLIEKGGFANAPSDAMFSDILAAYVQMPHCFSPSYPSDRNSVENSVLERLRALFALNSLASVDIGINGTFQIEADEGQYYIACVRRSGVGNVVWLVPVSVKSGVISQIQLKNDTAAFIWR